MCDETWTPRCPQCGDSLVLAPANQRTKHALAQVEVYCPHCQWIGKLGDNLKGIYVRV